MGRLLFHEGDQQTGGGETGKVHDQAHREAFGKQNRLDWVNFLKKIVQTDQKCSKRGHQNFDQFFGNN